MVKLFALHVAQTVKAMAMAKAMAKHVDHDDICINTWVYAYGCVYALCVYALCVCICYA